APTPVVWTKVLPPVSLLGAVPVEEVTAAGQASPLWPKYAQEVDRDSATELLAAKMGVPTPTAPAATPHEKAPTVAMGTKAGSRKPDGGALTGYLRSREGRSMLNTITRGVFGLLKK
ncbi:MAG TPA: helicase HerA-like domain-containing protein, partial [Acidimicrobiales bacterium]|nr:helicase HerA-like domain-containing protein [Acidimicrobiales bacterium]